MDKTRHTPLLLLPAVASPSQQGSTLAGFVNASRSLKAFFFKGAGMRGIFRQLNGRFNVLELRGLPVRAQ